MQGLTLVLGFLLAISQVQPGRDRRPEAVGTGRIAGTVVDAESGRSVRFARVTLMFEADDWEAVTDEGGAFAFTNLRAGSYQLQVSKPGYLDTRYGQARPGTDTPGKPITLAGRAAVVTITVPLSHGGSISGIVRDERGDPVFEAMVAVSRWTTSYGVRRLTPVEMATTDERGQYRISMLPPRDYVLSATKRFNAVPDSREGPAAFGFADRFFPGVPAASAAEPITVGPGEHKSGADFQLPLVALGRVSGLVVDGNGRPVAGAEVTLAHGDSHSLGISLTEQTEKDGRFTFEKVVPGAYTLTASTLPNSERIVIHGNVGNVRWERQYEVHTAVQQLQKEIKEITVDADRAPRPANEPIGAASSDVTIAGGGEANTTLTLEPPRTVSGRVVFEGTGKPRAKGIRIEMTDVVRDNAPPGVSVNDDGTFEVTNVVPGRYAMTVGGVDSPWALASISSGGADVLDFFLEVPRDRDVRDVTITLRDRRTELSGSVLDGAGRAAGDRTVIVFSAEERLWAGWQRVEAQSLGADNKYTFLGLRPGRYLMAVVDGVEDGEWLDPSFLRRIVPASIAVTLSDGETKVQDLRVR